MLEPPFKGRNDSDRMIALREEAVQSRINDLVDVFPRVFGRTMRSLCGKEFGDLLIISDVSEYRLY